MSSRTDGYSARVLHVVISCSRISVALSFFIPFCTQKCVVLVQYVQIIVMKLLLEEKRS